MEEQALYRAILAAPHDDTPRLVYADWLDENADAFPPAQARAERARAEFIRLQCKIARLSPTGWTQAPPELSDAELARRQRRLIFQHGRKWRRAFPLSFASAPFDRGFLRPFLSLSPYWFLCRDMVTGAPDCRPGQLPPLPAAGSARRYVPDELFAECPLWDVHLFVSGQYPGDGPMADLGQHGPLLADVGKSPQLERVGWLKLSLFQTSTVEFLRTGNFVNVETLVLNCVPFPEVLEAVAENESFRSLRYVQFGNDRAAWAGNFPLLLRYLALSPKILAANARNLPYGEMRMALRSILQSTPLVPVEPPPVPTPVPFRLPQPTPGGAAATEESASKAGLALGVLLVLFLLIVRVNTAGRTPAPPAPSVPQIKMPNYEPLKMDFKKYEIPKYSPEVEALLKQIREGKKPSEQDEALKDFLRKVNRDGKGKGPLPVAPEPRPVERKE